MKQLNIYMKKWYSFGEIAVWTLVVLLITILAFFYFGWFWETLMDLYNYFKFMIK